MGWGDHVTTTPWNYGMGNHKPMELWDGEGHVTTTPWNYGMGKKHIELWDVGVM